VHVVFSTVVINVTLFYDPFEEEQVRSTQQHPFIVCHTRREYFIRAEARRESVMDCICWLEHAWILQMNSNLMQYCTKRNECESEAFALRTKVALFSLPYLKFSLFS